ncbi:MAG: hypothetical protein F6J93_39325 [Oscillatoria sp. SIO1A7]|nr:hypothetical protein [Oscillatoria sp. SIO1A7]
MWGVGCGVWGYGASIDFPQGIVPGLKSLHPKPYTSGCGVWGVGCRETSCYFPTAVGGSKVLQGRTFRD